MTAVGINPKLIESGMPVLAAGGIIGAIDSVQRSIRAVVFLVKESLMALLVCFIGYLKGLAFLEIWSEGKSA